MFVPYISGHLIELSLPDQLIGFGVSGWHVSG